MTTTALRPRAPAVRARPRAPRSTTRACPAHSTDLVPASKLRINEAAIAGFAERRAERDGELRRGRLRQGQARPRRRRRRLRRHRQPREARGHAEVRRQVEASSTSRPFPHRSRCRTTSRASTSCKLDAETLAKIFQRQITKWNDAAIAATNSGVDLPSTAIVVAHRSDGSGTTSNFTKYLGDRSAHHVDARQR